MKKPRKIRIGKTALAAKFQNVTARGFSPRRTGRLKSAMVMPNKIIDPIEYGNQAKLLIVFIFYFLAATMVSATFLGTTWYSKGVMVNVPRPSVILRRFVT